MTKEALLDTDTLSYFFRGNPSVVEKIDSYLNEFGFLNISIITHYEVLNGLHIKKAQKQLAAFQQFIAINKVLPLTLQVSEVAAEIYAKLHAQGKPIGHNDVLIASTAIVNDLVLVTNNQNHFSRIEGLTLDNWA